MAGRPSIAEDDWGKDDNDSIERLSFFYYGIIGRAIPEWSFLYE